MKQETHSSAEIIVAKHRNGAVDDVRLQFKSEFTQFCNPESLGAVTFQSRMNTPSSDDASSADAGRGFTPNTSFDSPTSPLGDPMTPTDNVPF